MTDESRVGVFGRYNMIMAIHLMVLGSTTFLALREMGMPMQEAGNVMMLMWLCALLMLISRPFAMALQAVVNMVYDNE